MLGITGRDLDGNIAKKLPDPLAPGESIRNADDGTRLWNPVWNEPPSFDINAQFISTVVELVLERDKVGCVNNNSASVLMCYIECYDTYLS